MSGLSSILNLALDRPAFLLWMGLLPLLIWSGQRSLSGLGPVRGPLALVLRCLFVSLLALALAGVTVVQRTDDQTAVFVLDTSASVPRELQEQAFDFVRRATAGMRPGKDRVAVIGFDGRARVEQLAAGGLRVERAPGAGVAEQSHLAAGLRLATAILPPDTARRLVMLSDGNETTGDVLAESEPLHAAGIPVDVLPLTYEHAAEVLCERVSAPATARLEETIELSIVLRATRPTRGRLRIWQNERLVAADAERAQRVTLDAGPNRLSIPIPLREAGAHRFRVAFEPDHAADDTLARNNEGTAFTVVGGRERVLILGDFADERQTERRAASQTLADALGQSGIEAQVQALGSLTLDAPALVGYSCVVLDNVSATALSSDEQAVLASYTRDLGGGLIVVGGDRAFSVGGYFQTPLEEVLPVETERAKLKLLSVGLVIVLDCSGSMLGEKLSAAKKAAAGAVELLSSRDQLGVVAFEDSARWVTPLAPCADKPAIQARIAHTAGGGGTNMYPGLALAYEALRAQKANLNHVILLTDGQTAAGAFDALADQLAAEEITLSSIAIGDDADLALLERLATRTGGRMYVVPNAGTLPQIFARETVLVSRSGMFERDFQPALRSGPGSTLLAGFGPDDFPPLHGHVITALRPLAEAPLLRVGEESADPILAHWQVGLGRTVAFTSGMWGRWGRDWSAWPGFSKLWAQAVHWAARPANSTDFAAKVAVSGGRATVSLEAAAELNTGRGDLQFDAQVIGPDLKVRRVALQQTAPDRFETSFPLADTGNYVVRVGYRAGSGPGARSGVVQTGISHPHSAEWRDIRSNPALLAELARRTQGRVLRAEHASAVFEPWSIRPVETRRPLWGDLVRLAILVFLLDVAVRRLALNPLAAWRRWRGGAAAGVVTAAAGERLAALREARERLRREAGAVRSPGAAGRATGQVPSGLDRQAADGPAAGTRPAAPPASGAPAGDSAAGTPGYSERLKRAKRDVSS